MADDKDKDNEFEEEFDFESEDDLLESAESEFAETNDYEVEGSKKPPLPVLIGGGVAGLILILALGYFIFGSEEEAPPPPPLIVEPEPEPLPPPPAPDPWASSGNLLNEDEPAITPKDVIDKIDAQETVIDKKIKALDIKLNELLSKLSKLDQALVASTRDITDVNFKLEAINQELKMMAAPPPTAEKAEKVEKLSETFTNPTLTVHAIIPGRAWLKARDGKTITVTEGDAIEGYGKVLAIDAPTGVVITSSGVMLR